MLGDQPARSLSPSVPEGHLRSYRYLLQALGAEREGMLAQFEHMSVEQREAAERYANSPPIVGAVSFLLDMPSANSCGSACDIVRCDFTVEVSCRECTVC
jgi:hypothetical protein